MPFDNPYNRESTAREYERREAEKEPSRQAHDRFVGPSSEALARIRAAADCQQCYDSGYIVAWANREYTSRYCTCAAAVRERALWAALKEA